MGFFSKLSNLFKPPKEPKVEAPVVKRQKPKTITPPKANVFVQAVRGIKQSLKKQKQTKQFIPQQAEPQVQQGADKSPEEKAEIYVTKTLAYIERSVRTAKSKYTTKAGDSDKQKYANDILIHDALDAQLSELRQYIDTVISTEGYPSARKKLERVDWETFDGLLFYYPTCLDALPYVLSVIEASDSPIESTSVFDSSAQSDFEDEEFHY